MACHHVGVTVPHAAQKLRKLTVGVGCRNGIFDENTFIVRLPTAAKAMAFASCVTHEKAEARGLGCKVLLR